MTNITYRQLGKDGLSVSAISLGCMSLSGIYGEAEDAQSEALVREYRRFLVSKHTDGG